MNAKQKSAPAENFRKAMQKILSVPKKEIDRREAEYRKSRGKPDKKTS